MVNIVDTDKLMRNLITQFCDQHFKFQFNLKIFGSIHVLADNNEVLTCLLDEKFFKSPHSHNILQNPSAFNHHNQQLINKSNGSLNTNTLNSDALNLVKTLTQLQQQRNKMSQSSASSLPNGKSSKSSSSSSSSSSSTSSTSYTSSVLIDQSNNGLDLMQQSQNKHKRKRFTPRAIGADGKHDSTDASSSTSSSVSRTRQDNNANNNQNTDDDDDMSSEHNTETGATAENGIKHENEHPNDEFYNDNDSGQSANNTPLKRNKRSSDDQATAANLPNSCNDEAAAAAAGALSLISAAAVASKLLNSQGSGHNLNGFNTMNSQLMNGHANGANKPNYIEDEFNQNENQKPVEQLVEKKRGRHKKTKIETTGETFEKDSVSTTPVAPTTNGDDNNDADSDDGNQLYMDEDNNNEDDETNDRNNGLNNQDQQQHILMAAAAALMNNTDTNSLTSNPAANMKLFMPHNVALSLAAKHHQQQQDAINKKKKQKQAIMSPSSSSTSSINSITHSGLAGASNNSSSSTGSLKKSIDARSNKSTSSTSSSISSTTQKANKGRRRTIAALAAAAAQTNTSPSQNNPINQAPNIDLQRNLVAIASQYGLKDTSNLEQLFQEINDKNKIQANLAVQQAAAAAAAAVAVANKVNKKKFASASAHTTPNANYQKQLNAAAKSALKVKKTTSTFQDASNLLNTSQQQNAAAAAAAALHYQQLFNNSKSLNNSPIKPEPQTNQSNKAQRLSNNFYQNGQESGMADDENRDDEPHYDDDEFDDEYQIKNENYDEEEMMKQDKMNSSKNCTTPLAQSNTNGNQGPIMTPNLEFECSACEKKFKYYCYYKRHMDACHSE